jgi:hypothetical protein
LNDRVAYAAALAVPASSLVGHRNFKKSNAAYNFLKMQKIGLPELAMILKRQQEKS